MFILVSLLSLCSLGAESWRYAILGENEEYMELVESVLSTIGFVDGKSEMERVGERIERKNLVEYEKKKASLYEKEDYQALEKLEKKVTVIPSLLSMERVTIDDSYNDLLRENDLDAVEYITSQNDLDALIYIKSEGEGTIKEINLSINGESVRKAYYTNSLFSYEEEKLLSYFSSRLLSSSYSYYKITLEPSYSSLMIDGALKTAVSPFVILENGEHTFLLSASGYEDEEKKVVVNKEEREIFLSLSPRPSHPLYISSSPWNVELKVNGEKVEGKYIPSIHSPYTLSLSSPSFSSLSYQTTGEGDRVRLELDNIYLDDDTILEEKKNDFYFSLFSTLLSFGGYTAARAIENINGNQGPLKVVLGGISIVSLVNLVTTAMEYYGSAGQGI